jgi:hypothetical protein
MAKKASDVAVVTARNTFLSDAVSKATTREKSTSSPPVKGPQADEYHQQQAGDLDNGQRHIEFHALADATQVDCREHRHEQQRDDDNSDLAPIEVERRVEVRREEPRRGGRRRDA